MDPNSSQPNKALKKHLKHLLYLSFLFVHEANAQRNQVISSLEASGIFTSEKAVPFWLRSNRYGSIPLTGVSSSFAGRVTRQYQDTVYRFLDWGASIEAQVNVGPKTETTMLEGYLKGRIGALELRAGRTKETMGLIGAPELSSGSFSVSGNALGIPQVSLSLFDYYTLPIFQRLFAIKGTLSVGSIGSVPVRPYYGTFNAKTYFHQKSFYAKMAHENWPVELIGGFNHQVIWGNEDSFLGPKFKLSPLQSLMYVMVGKTYGGRGTHTERSKVGNHIGSVDLGANIKLSDSKLMLYRQNFYDVGALAHLANLRDGLTGVMWNNNKPKSSYTVAKVVVEYFSSKNQAGEADSKITKSGDENYYNSYIYLEGWSYQGLGLGNPLITAKTSTRKDLPNDPMEYFNNNRIIASHFALEIEVNKLTIDLKTSYSRNYGTYGTSSLGRSLGVYRIPPKYGIFPVKEQFYGFLKSSYDIGKGTNIHAAFAFDRGGVLENSQGAIIGIKKSFN